MDTNATDPRSLADIASEIRATWPKVYFGAVPYLQAMSEMTDVTANYGADGGKDIVRYFLANASTYKGDAARRIKGELKKMVGLK